jgi:S1/P1 Nuclease
MKVYTMRPYIAIFLVGLMLLLRPATGHCWGDEGHEIVGLIAEHYLEPAVRARVIALLAQDASGLTRGTGIAEETTWADKFRDTDRDTTQRHYLKTRAWHYIDIELDRPDLDEACFGHPARTAGSKASEGPADDCILDKIDEFRGELRSPTTGAEEQRLALQFLLHLVGDLHQPLHAADNHDHGGNDVRVKGAGSPPGNLHHYWDTVFVRRLGTRADDVSRELIAGISDDDRRAWSAGSPADWAKESFQIGRNHVYGPLQHTGALSRAGARTGAGADAIPGISGGGPPGPITLDAQYEANAASIVAGQLQRAGLRLARLLNDALR